MMKKFKVLESVKRSILAALMATGLLVFTACGMGNGTNDGTDAPYENDANSENRVNEGMDNNNMGEDIKNGIDNIGDDINNGIDNLENGIENGIDNMENGMDDMNNHQSDSQNNTQNNTQNDTQNNGSNGTSSLEKAGKNLMNSIEEASAAIRDGIQKLSNNK